MKTNTFEITPSVGIPFPSVYRTSVDPTGMASNGRINHQINFRAPWTKEAAAKRLAVLVALNAQRINAGMEPIK